MSFLTTYTDITSFPFPSPSDQPYTVRVYFDDGRISQCGLATAVEADHCAVEIITGGCKRTCGLDAVEYIPAGHVLKVMILGPSIGTLSHDVSKST